MEPDGYGHYATKVRKKDFFARIVAAIVERP